MRIDSFVLRLPNRMRNKILIVKFMMIILSHKSVSLDRIFNLYFILSNPKTYWTIMVKFFIKYFETFTFSFSKWRYLPERTAHWMNKNFDSSARKQPRRSFVAGRIGECNPVGRLGCRTEINWFSKILIGCNAYRVFFFVFKVNHFTTK